LNFRTLDPFFRIIEESLGDLVDGDHFFDLLSDDVVFDFVITVPKWRSKDGPYRLPRAGGRDMCPHVSWHFRRRAGG
jgi:hypothetical protein